VADALSFPWSSCEIAIEVCTSPSPRTTTAPLRSAPVAFAATETCSTSPSAPHVRLNVTHDGDDSTHHPQRLVRTVALTDPDATPNLADATDNDTAGAAACVTVKVAVAGPATSTTLPVRATDPRFHPAVTANHSVAPST
jgi:hypothetical protein